MINLETIIYALLGGILPALIWLSFWLREDYKHPEPKGLILKTFVFGMIAVPISLVFQTEVNDIFPGRTLTTIILWVLIEEIFKFSAGYFGGLHTIEDNEPIDPIIYMITAALGFVALENALFIFEPLVGKDIVNGLITGNLRFIGASLLHVVSSGMIGAAIAFSFYRSKIRRVVFTLIALILAVIIHSSFNLAIIHWNTSGTMLVFGLVWIGVIILLLAFERAKTIAR